jgi:hypothetical protein
MATEVKKKQNWLLIFRTAIGQDKLLHQSKNTNLDTKNGYEIGYIHNYSTNLLFSVAAMKQSEKVKEMFIIVLRRLGKVNDGFHRFS